MTRPWIAASVLAIILIIFRLATATSAGMANMSPVVSVLFLGAAFWKTNKWMLPAGVIAWLLTTPAVSIAQGYSPFNMATLSTIATLGLVVFFGMKFKANSPFKLIGGTLLAATLFYIITNTISFFSDPVYTKNLSGYVQCMWTGSSLASTPTWTFFRNSLVSNGLASVLFLLTMSVPAISKASNFRQVMEVK